MIKGAIALLSLATLAGCATSQPAPSTATFFDRPDIKELMASADQPVKRSGVSSDARNPSGAPGRPTAWYER